MYQTGDDRIVEKETQNIGQDQSRIFDRRTLKYWTEGLQNIGQEDGIKIAQDFRIHLFDKGSTEQWTGRCQNIGQDHGRMTEDTEYWRGSKQNN